MTKTSHDRKVKLQSHEERYRLFVQRVCNLSVGHSPVWCRWLFNGVSVAPPVMYLAVETFLGGYDPGRRGSRESDQ